MVVADDDMVSNEEEIVLRDGAGSSSETRYALLPRAPAQVHGRSPDSAKNSPDEDQGNYQRKTGC